MLPHYSILYSIPYVFVVFILFIFVGIENKYYRNNTKKSISISSAIIILLFIGFRGHIQTDFIQYYPFFQSLNNIDSVGYNISTTVFEPGFVIYSTIVKQIFNNYYIWIFINTTIDIFVFTWLFKKYSCSVALSWIFFILFSGLVLEFNLLRNSKAIVLFLISIPYIEKRRLIPFLLLWSLEMTLHLSSILYLPMYWLINRQYNRKLIIIMFLFVNFLLFTKTNITSMLIDTMTRFMSEDDRISMKAVGYFLKGEENTLSLGYIEKTSIFILCVIYYKKLYEINKSNLIFCNAFFIYYILWYMFSDVKVFVERFPILFAFSYWIICPNLIFLLRVKTRSLIIPIIFLFSIFKIVSITNQRPYYYENIIWGISSYEQRQELINSWRRK